MELGEISLGEMGLGEMGQNPNTNDSSNLSDIFARCGWTISPLLEKNSFNRAELAGTTRILSNKYPRGTNSIWVQMSASFVSLSK